MVTMAPSEKTLQSYLADAGFNVKEELDWVLRMLAPSMTTAGLEYLIFCSETCRADSWWTRSGGAAYVAANVLGVPFTAFVEWMKTAEGWFTDDRTIIQKLHTSRYIPDVPCACL